MLYQSDFTMQEMKRVGLGGILTLATAKSDRNLSYVIKAQSRAQSVNEYLAQSILKALNMYHVPVEWFMLSGWLPFGAVRYIDGLKKLSYREAGLLAAHQLEQFIRLFILNGLLQNNDTGEIFLTPDNHVCGLDFGEAIMPTIFAESILAGMPQLVSCIAPLPLDREANRLARNFATRHIEIVQQISPFGISKDQITDSCLGMLEDLADLDIDCLDECFCSMDEVFYQGVSKEYRNHIQRLISAAKYYLDYLARE